MGKVRDRAITESEWRDKWERTFGNAEQPAELVPERTYLLSDDGLAIAMPYNIGAGKDYGRIVLTPTPPPKGD